MCPFIMWAWAKPTFYDRPEQMHVSNLNIFLIDKKKEHFYFNNTP